MIASTNLYMPVCLPVWALDQAACEMNSRTVITERLGPHFDDVNILRMYQYWYVVYMMLSAVYTLQQ